MAPLFLAGLLAIAIPVLVHLMHKERKEPVPFPSLMFLRRVPFRSAKRQRIRYWLLFLLRTAALLLIVTAFARPWLSSPRAASVASGGKDIVVLIDRSYSMSANGAWERALREAASVVRSAGTNDRVTVAAFGERAQLLARWEDGRNAALAALSSLEPGHEVTRFAPALRLAGSVLAQSRGPAEVVWITDRQKTGAGTTEPVAFPANTNVRVVDVHRPATRNYAVTHVALASSAFAGRTRVTPAATVFNSTDASANIVVDLRVDGRVRETRNVTVPPHDSAVAAFAPIAGDAAAGEVRIRGSDDLPIDDVAYFSVAATVPHVRIQAPSGDAAFYFENALRAGDSAAFRVSRGGARLSGADLRDLQVLVVLESALPQGDVAADVTDFVEAGGGLIIAGAGARSSSDLLPVRDADQVERRARAGSIAGHDLSHPVFAAFRADGTAPFTGTRIQRYVKSQPVEAAVVIARFDDGAPALVEQRMGRGRILFWASAFSRSAGDFVLQPAFVPFVQQLVRYAADPARVTRTYTVGNVLAVDNFVPTGADANIVTPARELKRLPKTNAPRTLRIDQASEYHIRASGTDAGAEVIVANVDARESSLAAVPASYFSDLVERRAPASSGPSANTASLGPREDASRQRIWWYLLAAAFAILAIETLLGNRTSIVRQSPGST
jgi:hypothetical protein